MVNVASGLRAWIYRLIQLISEILCTRIICEHDLIVYYPRAVVIVRSRVQFCVHLYAIAKIRREEILLEATDR